MSVKRFLTPLLVAAFALFGAARSADAATILTFSQQTDGLLFVATENGDGSTTVTANDIVTNLGFFFGTGGSVNGIYFNLSATSTAAATGAGVIEQPYSGTFSFTSGAGGTGVNYLSGSFTDILFGVASSSAANLSATTAAGDTVSFTSAFGTLFPNLGINLSLISVTPVFAIVNNGGNTIRAFSASVSGVFQADEVGRAVPEPASLMLFGSGLVGLGAAYRRRQRRRQAKD